MKMFPKSIKILNKERGGVEGGEREGGGGGSRCQGERKNEMEWKGKTSHLFGNQDLPKKAILVIHEVVHGLSDGLSTIHSC